MEYICVVVSAGLAIFFYMWTRKVYNAGTIFLGYWAIITFLAALSLDGARPIRQSTYGLILLGLTSFAAGCFFCITTKHKPQVNSEYNFQVRDYRLLELACVVIIIYCLYRVTIIASFLADGYSWGSIRMMHGIAGAAGENTLKGGTWSQVLHDYFVGPCIYLLAPLFAVEMFLGNRDKKFLLLTFVSMVLYSVATVSRAIWAFSILYLTIILVAFIHRKDIPQKIRKRLKMIPIFGVALFGVIIIITKSRSESSQVNLMYNMLAYLSGGINLFDIHLQEPIADIRTYGFFSLYGFIHPIFFALNYLGILKYPGVFNDISNIKLQLENYVQISNHVNMNAYSTLFFNFYNDFGIFGVFLGSFLFGYFCMLSYVYFTRKKDVRTLVCYLILIQFMIFSMARIYTIYTTRALSLVLLLFLIPVSENSNSHRKKRRWRLLWRY